MSSPSNRGPHPVPESEERKASARRGAGKQEPNTHLERRQDRNRELTEKSAAQPERTRSPDPANH